VSFEQAHEQGVITPQEGVFMSSVTLYRASGLALLLGAVLAIIGSILTFFVFQYLTPLWLVTTLAWNSGLVLLLLGSPGIVARQAPRAGWLGFVGFLLMFLGWFLLASYVAMGNLTISTWLAVHTGMNLTVVVQ